MSINPMFYSEDVKKIVSIDFSIYRDKDIKQYSAVSNDPFGINLPESYENYEPKKGGLVDLRLGTCDIYLNCLTCGENLNDCPGHFGHIELAQAVFHFGFLQQVKNIMQCICLKCSKPLVDNIDALKKKNVKKKAETRYKEIKILTKNVNYCYNCGWPVPKIKREVKDNGPIRITIERDIAPTGQEKEEGNLIKKIRESLSPRDIYNIFRNITDEDAFLIGFDYNPKNPKELMQRPEDLILLKFPVPPVAIRPTAKVDLMSAATAEDALTLKISDIVTWNKRVRAQMEKETISNELSTYNQDIFNLLQYHVATYYDNESVGLPRTEFKTGGRATKSISDRIKGKHGRIRSNLMGKRVNFSARSVITSDPYIDIDQVGIPKKIAMELTIPEEVTPYNIKHLTGLVKNGRDVYPGANYVLRINYRDGKPEIQKIDLKYRKKAIRLNLGDIVERHSVDGDYVLFNRQPTLHKPSMMGHKIQVLDDENLHTFRMNVSVTKPYNADFDGDEMNIHMAQSIQARNELKRIANVQLQIVGAKDSSPIIGCKDDTLTGAYILTNPKVRMMGWEVANILCNTTSENKFELDMNKEYTGQEIFSFIIPKGINSTKYKDGKVDFQISNGKLIQGYLDKSALSFAKNSIIHFIWDKYGPSKTRRFIDDSQRLVLNYLLNAGLTVGFKDTVISDNMYEKVQQIISNKILESKYNITQYENDIDQISLDTIESTLTSDLGPVQATVGQMLMNHWSNDNFFWNGAKSGSKGSAVNMAQVGGVLGQQSLEGSRIKKKVEGRSLIYFHKDDDTPEARGFVKNSYFTGLKGFEFFYNAMGGREGLIDTAIKSVTWETPIVIIENREPKYIEIGKWIDGLLNANKDSVEHYTERQMELLSIENNKTFIPTTDSDGNVSWGEITAVTRHDPGNELYEIKTNGGRSVIVTESKSLLIWNKEQKKLVETLTPDIKVGDCVPVTEKLSQPPIIKDYIGKYELNKVNGGLIAEYILGKFNNIDNEMLSYLNNNNNDILKSIIISSNECINEFIKVLALNSNINESGIYYVNESQEIINNISMIYSRIGVYGKINKFDTCYEFAITGKYANNIVKLINVGYNYIDIDDDIENYNDVVLDEIVEINLIDVNLHKKVYDLTIPSTFNFGLANGLQVRDTAQTGYIQRQLVKGLEDLCIRYDGTNRSAKGTIVQIVYGENGINQATQTELIIGMLGMNNKTLSEKLCFSSDQLKKLEKAHKMSAKELKEFNDAHLEKLIRVRDEMRQMQMRATINYKTMEEKFMSPVNLFRITQDYSNNKENLDLTPQEIVKAIEDLLDDYDTRLITSMRPSDNYLKKGDRELKFLFEIALNEYLAPNKCIFDYGLSKKDFVELMKEIKFNFIKAIIEPGEMVGIVAAQSCGEVVSQMSVSSNTEIKIIIRNTITKETTSKTVEIGKLCDEIIENYPDMTFNTGHIDSVETELSKMTNEYYIIGVDNKEKTHWNKISHISRHPVNGQLMTVTTRSGRKVTTTLSHSHLIRRNQTVEPITGSNLKVGMRIPLNKHIDNDFINKTIMIDNKSYELDYLFGWFIGAYLAEGNINHSEICISNISKEFIANTQLFANRFNTEAKVRNYQGEYGPSTSTKFNHKQLSEFMLNTIGTGSFVKIVPDFIFTAPNEFKAGLIQAYFDGDGNFQADDGRHQIRVCSRSEKLINGIALLLNYFDIASSIKTNFTRGSNIYNLTISAKYSILYKQHINTLLHKEKLDSMIDYVTRNDAHTIPDVIDKINGLGDVIAKCGKTLMMEGQSRTYGMWKKKEAIGRRTLGKYIEVFEAHEKAHLIRKEIAILRQAYESNVIWDEIVDIKIYTPDQKDYVYDFTVPGNQTFMVDSGIIVHNTLNTKHFAGVASKGSANMGVGRIEEILHYSKNIKTPQMMIYFKDNYTKDRLALNKIVSYLKHLSIRQLISSAEVYYDLGSSDENSKKLKNDNVSSPYFINSQKAELSSLPFVFRIKMDIEKMLDKETTLMDIKTKFISHWQKNYTNTKNLKKNEKDVISRISRCAILSNGINDKEQIIHIRFNMSSFNYTLITEFLRMVFDDITLKGIENIQAVDVSQEMCMTFDKETGDIKSEKEYMSYTAGINFERLRMIKGIDFTKTKCNDTATMLRLYGIEATRQILIHELTTAYQGGGSNINQNHLSLLIDQMCSTGEITSIDRHGMRKLDIDPITRASFENTMDHFVNAALFNEKDMMRSVSSRVAIGRVMPGGTGSFDLILDTKKLVNSEYTEDETGGRVTYAPLEEEPLLSDIIKNPIGKSEFFIPN